MSDSGSNTDEISNIQDDSGKHVKRPMNAFMLWSKQRRREISKQDPTLHNAQISKLLGEDWKLLSAEEKLPFVEESQKLMSKHKKENPNYRYKPRQNKIGKAKVYPSHSQRMIMENKREFRCESKYPYPYKAPPIDNERDYPHVYSMAVGHRPYYSRYSICNVPGCYECSYERPFDQPPPPPPSHRYGYHTKRHMYEGYGPPPSSHYCHCCSQQNLPRYMSSYKGSSSSSSFTVESMISSDEQQQQSSSCGSSSKSGSSKNSNASDSNDDSS